MKVSFNKMCQWSLEKHVIRGIILLTDKKIVFKYVLQGMKKIKETNVENGQPALSETAEEVFKFFESIENFKHCEDEVRSAALIDSLQLSLDHVPGHMLKSEEVMHYIIKIMRYSDFL